MSVTLKLADNDAAMIARVLRAVKENVPVARDGSSPDFEAWKRNVTRMSQNHGGSDIAAIAGAFEVAVQANAR